MGNNFQTDSSGPNCNEVVPKQSKGIGCKQSYTSNILWCFPGSLFQFFLILQKTNVLAGGINSACNPAFYCLFMPSFRRALIKTFFPCLEKEGKRDADNCSDNSSRTGTSSSNPSIPAAHIQ